MRKLLAKYAGLPLNDMVKGYHVRKYLAEYQRHLTLSKKEIADIQLSKLQRLIHHAYQHTRLYRNRMELANVLPGNLKTLNDIEKLPFLTRADLQNSWHDLIADYLISDRLHKGSSSGSTGHPVTYFHDKQACSAGDAALHICWKLAGWELGMKGLHIWGNPTTVKNEWSRKSSKIKSWIFNHEKFPAYLLTDPCKLKELALKIESGDYDFIDGYTNSIYVLAEYCQKNSICLKKPLKMVLTTAENLHDYQRDMIEKVLGPVYDLYGCGEIHGVANECRACGRYHIIDTHVLVEFGEVVDEFGNRELIITDLDNFAFPLIRYKNGDAGNPGGDFNDCPVPFKTMDQISGRQSDIIRLPGGGTLSVPSFFGSMLLKKVKGIHGYQVEKVRSDHLIIRLVVDNSFDQDDIDTINLALQDYLSDRIRWEIIFVGHIPIPPSGKFKLVIDNSDKK